MSSISYFSNKIKSIKASNNSLIFSAFIVILASVGSFLLGQMYAINTTKDEKVQILNSKNIPLNSSKSEISNNNNSIAPIDSNASSYVASKNGKLYYRVGCGASTRILDKNKVYFNTTEDAVSAGFEPSSSCTP